MVQRLFARRYSSCFEQLSQVPFDSDAQLCRCVSYSLRLSFSHSVLSGTSRRTSSSTDLTSIVPILELTVALYAVGINSCIQFSYSSMSPRFCQRTTKCTIPVQNQFDFGERVRSWKDRFPAQTQMNLLMLNMEEVYATTVGFVSCFTSYSIETVLKNFQYAVPTLIYIFLLYISGKVTEAVLLRFSRVFEQLSFENKRNTVTCETAILPTFGLADALLRLSECILHYDCSHHTTHHRKAASWGGIHTSQH